MSRTATFLRWTPRVLSIISIGVTAFFILLFLTWPWGGAAPFNPAIMLLGAIIVATLAAWPWPRVGGAFVLLLTVGTVITIYITNPPTDLREFVGSTAIVAVPHTIVGLLFLLIGSQQSQ